MPGKPETPNAARQVSDEPSPRRLLSSEKVYEGRIWDVVSDSFQLSDDGEPLVRDYIDHPGAVAVLPDERRRRGPADQAVPAPGGHGPLGDPGRAARRRGRGLRGRAPPGSSPRKRTWSPGRWNVLADFFNSPGSSSEAIRIYLARDLSDVPGHELHVRTDEEAEIELHWIPLDEAVAAVLDGRLHNPSAVVGILAAAAARARRLPGPPPGRRAVARPPQPALMAGLLAAEPPAAEPHACRAPAPCRASSGASPPGR